MSNVIVIEVTGNFRSGTASKSGKPYCMFEAYAHLPNIPYPQKCNFYAESPQQVPKPGKYECDINASVRDDRLTFDVDPRQGRFISTAAASAPVQKTA